MTVLGWLWMIYVPLHYELYFALYICLVFLFRGVVPINVNFTFLGTGYFHISINILELFYGAHKLLGSSLTIVNFAFKICYVESQQLSQRLISPHYWGKTLLCTLWNVPWILRFSNLAGGKKDFSQLCVNTKHNVFNTFGYSSLASGGFLTHGFISTLLKTERKSFQMSFISLWSLCSLIFSPENSSHLVSPKFPHHLLNSGTFLSSPLSPSLSCSLENLKAVIS